MKKSIIKIVCIFMCLCCLFLAACDKTPDGDDTNKIPVASNTAKDYDDHKVSGTIHYGYDQLKDTGMPFVVNEETEYKIVYNDSDDNIATAAGYIIDNVKKATGATLLTETNPTWSAFAKYIVLGDKTLEQSAGVSITKQYDLSVYGYEILTKGNSVFILADGGDGYYMGTLAFLRIVLGYEYLDADVIVYEKDGSYIPEMDIIERPDFDFRGDRTEYFHSIEKGYGMGLKDDNSLMIPVNRGSSNNGGIHNTFFYINPDIYDNPDDPENYHPEFYTEERAAEDVNYEDKWGIWPAQLCYTAHGNEESKKMMQQLIADRIVELAFEEVNKDYTLITVSQQDQSTHCKCDACAEIEEEYGAISAAIIMFINGVDDIVQAEFERIAQETGEPKRVMNILFFAYQDSRFAPNKVDENTTCNENVGIYFAASKTKYSWTFYDSINDPESNEIRQWAKHGKLYFYLYRYNCMNYFMPSNIFSSTVTNFRFCKEMNGNYISEEAGYEQPYLTGFTAFKEYLTSRLLVNVNLEYDDLKETFFKHYFGDGGVYMEQFFDELTGYMSYLRDSGDNNFYGCVVNENPDETKYWPYQMMERWMDLCNQAYKAIEKTKIEDPEMYQVYKDHILIETLFPRYVLCMLHDAQFDSEVLFEMRKEFIADCQYLKCKKVGSYTITIEELAKSWGV